MAIVYRVYGKKTSDSGAEQVMKDNITEKSVVVDGLDPSTEYQLTVSARDGASESVNNPSVTAATATVPGKPSVTVTAGDGVLHATAVLPENDGGSDVTNVKFFIKEASDGTWPAEPSATQSKDDLTYDFTGLTNGTEYSVAAVATNAVGDSEMSDAAHGTPAASGS